MCIEYHISVNMYHVSAQGIDERMINVRYYYYYTDDQGERFTRSTIMYTLKPQK